MKKNILIFVLIFYVTLLSAQTKNKKLALVIGNANYTHSGKLKNPVNDADLMTTTLEKLDFTVIKITDATKTEMDKAILEFSRKLANFDIALFYYAGHGVQVNGINYLIPIDAKLEDKISVSFEAVSVSKIVQQFEYYPDNLNIVILDACRDNPFRSWQRGGTRGFKAITAPSGTIISFATREGETASDGTGSNGLFTEQLVTQMKKPQSIEQVFKNTRVSVLKISDNKQCPQEWSMFTGNFNFTKDDNNNNNNNNNNNSWDVEYGSLQINTAMAGMFFLDGIQIGLMQQNTQKIKSNLTAGDHTYKFIGEEFLAGTITIYKNQTTKLNIQSTQYNNNNDYNNNNNNNNYDNNNNNYDNTKYTDLRNNKIYKIVTIGNQTWFAENLAYKSETGCVSYNDEKTNATIYGYLYNWETAVSICPDGWHLPTKEEFETLLNNSGGEGEAAYNALIPAGNTGFKVLFGGYANLFGSFFDYDSQASFWTTSQDFADNKWYLDIDNFFEKAEMSFLNKDAKLSVRCLKD